MDAEKLEITLYHAEKTISHAIKWVVIGLIGYQVASAIPDMFNALGGKVTIADLSLRLQSDESLAKAADDIVNYCSRVFFAAIFLSVTCLLFGYNQRKLRLEKTVEMAARIKKLEALFDPGRTSSNLTETGETNPDDL